MASGGTTRARFGILAALLGAAGALAGGAAATAADPPEGVLDDAAEQVRWRGELTAPVAPPVPEACDAGHCDEFSLEIALPDGTFARPGSVQIGIRWRDEAQDADLFVFDPDGELAAKSDGFFASTAESVALQSPRNGTYRVVVVPRFLNGEDAMPFQGLAEVERPARARPLRRLLPNLVAMRPRNLSFSIGAYLFDPATPAGEASSCYPEEMAEQGARRCMRFDQILANLGDGPFELRYRMDGIATDPQLRQRIYRSDGSHRDRVADSYEFHPAHAHFHYRNFAQSQLWAAGPDGARVGDEPLRSGRKNGFCMIDVENVWFGRKGDGARTYYFPRCNAPTEVEGEHTYMVNGISPGWADVYNWFLADQFIEVSDVPDGCYVLRTEADPKDTIVESDESDNTHSVLLRLEGDAGEFLRRSQAASACG
jgi:hypothetical protein